MVFEVINSARAFAELRGAETIIACDGVRPEAEHLRERYEGALQEIAWWCNLSEPNVLPVILETWQHQAHTLAAGLAQMRSELVVMLEHDAPLLPVPIDWAGCAEVVGGHELDVMRFLHESQILREHGHLLVDTVDSPGPIERRVPYLRTGQWSQRPHLARRAWYQDLLHRYFAPESRCFVEEVMHGVCDFMWREFGEEGWEQNRIGIYADPEPTMQRSTHLDGRAGEPHYAESQIFAYAGGGTPPGAPRATADRPPE